LDTPSYV